MKYVVLLLVFLLCGCTEAFRAPSVFYNDDDSVSGHSYAIFDASCSAEKGMEPIGCGKRYSPVARNISNLETLSKTYEIVKTVSGRNEIQKLLLSLSDEVCSQYQYQILGVQLGAKVGANLLVATADTIKALLSFGISSELSGAIVGLFSNSSQILDDDLIRVKYFSAKMQEVHEARREMKKVIMVAQGHKITSNSDDAYNAGAYEQEITVGYKYYTMTEAVADAVAYHRTCDLGQMVLFDSILKDSHENLYAYRFHADWQKENE